MLSFTINPVRLIRGLSMALELAVDGLNAHHWRVAVICRHLAQAMNLPLPEKWPLVMAALLHDIGAASDFSERRWLLKPAEPEKTGLNVFRHAEDGWRVLTACSCLSHLAEIVRHHHDRWSGGNPTGTAGQAIPVASRVIHLADSLEIKINKRKPVMEQRDELCRFLREKSGREYDPDVVAALMETAQKDSFWLDLSQQNRSAVFFEEADSWGLASYTADDLLNIAEVFAYIIDRMSVFTANHSRSVSRAATLLAGQCCFCESELILMKTAGLLHDLGKLTIPNSILQKPGKLTPEEMLVMRQHTYYTYNILRQIGQMETAAEWGAFHHETLDGAGYPFRLGARDLSLGSRIMAVADIFVALAENRPYRARLERGEVERIMRGLAANGKIDRRVLGMLLDIYPQADAIILNAASRGGAAEVALS